jgi:cellulose synthase/poly-beta-1,6-N-acetylglucosamine synthase-like glycosyltransferase
LEQLFFAALSFQAFYYLMVFSRLYFYRTQDRSISPKTPVSVVICARNEAENLKKNLPPILQQDYHSYEVLVVDDASGDNSREILTDLQAQFTHLRFLSITPDQKMTLGKKQALSLGIEAATYEHVLLTDADCFPASRNWINSMALNFSEESQLILGVGPYVMQKSLLSALVAYETALTAQQYLSYALWDMAYMGVGRNLAYSKSLFRQAGGLAQHFYLPSGDDDLLVQQAAISTNVGICISKDSLMYSEAPENWTSWLRQKTRHYSTGKHYRLAHRFFLGTFLASKLLLYPIWLIAMILSPNLPLVIGMGAYQILVSSSLLNLQKKSGLPISWWLVPVLDPLYAFSTVVLGLFSTFRQTAYWK